LNVETSARYLIVGIVTVIVAAAGFVFVYWLHSTGGVSAKQSVYRVRFDAPVIGLRPGVAVLFNGMRVGEVQAVALDPSNPTALMASIGVDSSTPVGEDTRVGVETAGLLGSINVSLSGGVSHVPPKSGPVGEPPLLLADLEASASLGQAARHTLSKVDAILNDNSSSIHNTLANLSAFSDALARNSDRVDNILTGLDKMMGGKAPPPPPAYYDLIAPKFPSPERPLTAQLDVAEPTSLVMFQTQRALVSPSSGERIPLEGGQWGDNLPMLVGAKMVETLENAGFAHVAAAREGLAADMHVTLDIRAFEMNLQPTPSAHVNFVAKLLGADGKIIAAQSFEASSPASSAGAADAFAALNQAFGKAAYDFGVWMTKTI
jgi:phospholipid/cholesterol/gamma-HCH transport system substrate-binding protein